jgi:CDP-glucose 4,6-dehydratase
MEEPTPQLLPFERALRGRRICVTGHTGFTGGWACVWLRTIGAEVCGYSLEPETSPNLFDALGLRREIPTRIGDIRDARALRQFLGDATPDLVLHLAAQPLVRRSFREPLETFSVNALGTAHVLEAARATPSVRGVVCVTTDKVYRNNEWPWPYRESDELGGKDPYSASKSAAELVIQSYAASFPWKDGAFPAIATARGGNIIGGGDWSEDRLIPDFVRSVVGGTPLTLRYPQATRPWQHVLALVQAYMMLLAGLLSDDRGKYARAWNFGPQEYVAHSVREVLEMMASCWKRPDLRYMSDPLPEAVALALDSSLARNVLEWEPAWNTPELVRQTASWYRDFYDDPASARSITGAQIEAWRATLRTRLEQGA